MSPHHFKNVRHIRSGNVSLLSVFLLVATIGVTALSVETGTMAVSKTELQRCADSAAMAALGEYMNALSDGSSKSSAQESARDYAVSNAAKNRVAGAAPAITTNSTNDATGNVVFGRVDFAVGSSSFVPDSTNPNSIKVTVRRTTEENGEVPLLFANVLGSKSKPFTGTAIAAIATEIKGFTTPGSANLNILPFVVHVDDWEDLMHGNGDDDYAWNEETQSVETGSDGVLEINMFPSSTTPGNFGTVDIGNSNNSNADLKRQIEEGVSADDLAYHGGRIELDSNGELILNGDTGISAGMKSSLESIKGRPSVIMLYTTVSGNGNTTNYTIVKFVGIRVVDVKLTGKNKRITVQPTQVEMRHTIPANGNSSIDTSENICTPVFLID